MHIILQVIKIIAHEESSILSCSEKIPHSNYPKYTKLFDGSFNFESNNYRPNGNHKNRAPSADMCVTDWFVKH